MEFCRLCQVQEGTLNFMENQVFIQKVAECTNINIDDDNKDSLPRKVCGACKLSIDQFHVFLLNVRDVNKKLHHHLSNLLLENKKNNKSGKATKTQIKCSSCTKTFMTAKSLEIHKKAHHSNLNCDKCNVKFEDSKSAQSHVCFEVKFNEVSSFDERVQDSAWHCYKCNLKFEDSASGQNHQCLEECLMVEESQDPETDAADAEFDSSLIISDSEFDFMDCAPSSYAEATEGSRAASVNELPAKSSSVYHAAYKKFIKWCEEKNITDYTERVLLRYFSELATELKMKSSTMWSQYSMIRSLLNIKHSVDISRYSKLRAYLKKQNEGYIPKKSRGFTKEQFDKFLSEASDEKYLVMKVVLIIGISGACRCEEMVKMKIDDIEDLGSLLHIKIPDNKSNKTRSFIVVGETFINIYRKYASLRPDDMNDRRFFVKYQDGKCHRLVMGIHKIGSVPREVASYLKLKNWNEYTGHSLRRTSATLLVNDGANVTTLKRHEGWKSNSVAEAFNIEEPFTIKTELDIEPLSPNPNPEASSSSRSDAELF